MTLQELLHLVLTAFGVPYAKRTTYSCNDCGGKVKVSDGVVLRYCACSGGITAHCAASTRGHGALKA